MKVIALIFNLLSLDTIISYRNVLPFNIKARHQTKSYALATDTVTKSSSTDSVLTSLTLSTSTTTKKFEWQPEGYKTWKYDDYNINYVDLGKSDSSSINKPPLILIHGFGASVFHWRFNMPELSQKYHVFALDLLGFGGSDKPIIDYDSTVWRDQILNFIEQVVFKETNSKQPCVVAGNSLGGFAALAAAASNTDTKNLIRGCILLNAAGRFRDPSGVELVKKESPAWLESITATIQRFIISLSFYYTKQPSRVEQILKQVYADTRNVDDELVASIIYPAQDSNAPEVFYRVISRNGNGPAIFIDEYVIVKRYC